MKPDNPEADGGGSKRDAGLLPAWGTADLPEPPAFSLRNVFAVIGPGAILLATSIGGGEWLVGPAAGAKFGTQVMWIATISIILQVIFNLEAVRYTLYTGEPIYGGFLRLKPGPRFWGIFYCSAGFLSLGWPALAASCASTLFSSFAGRLMEDSETGILYGITAGVIIAVLLVLSFGGTVERMLEKASWFMLVFVFSFLVVVNLVYVPWPVWRTTLKGFLLFTNIGGTLDWSLMASLAATAGSGGIGNLTISNWVRDKGFGMGKLVGAIPSAIGGSDLKLSHIGTTFEITPANLKRWRVWQKYVAVDQIWIWGLLAFWGMFLNVNLAAAVIPHGTDLSGLAAGAYQARYLADHFWAGFWFLTLINGFWILFSTQLGNTDILIRTITDNLWMMSAKLREREQFSIRKIYYTLLIAFSAWGFVAVRFAPPFVLFQILANVAGFILTVASLQIWIVNRRFLPREIRAAGWRQAVLIACFLFYGFFTARWLYEFAGRLAA